MAEGKIGLGDFLVSLGVLTVDQLKKALQEQKQRGERLEQTLIRLKYAKEDRIMQCLADHFSLPFIDLNTYLLGDKVIKMIPEEMARRHTLIPLFAIGNTITVAIANPLNIFALDEVKNATKKDVEIAISQEEKIQKAIDKHYGSAASVLQSTIQQLVKGEGSPSSVEPIEYHKTYNLAVKDPRPGHLEEASATQMFDGIMIQAIRDRASDIHLEPEEKVLRVRLRVDGLLHELLTLPKTIHSLLTSRIKIMAEMDIAETRLPQDGSLNVKLGNRSFDIRVSTFPTIYGENVVLRLLDQSSPLIKLEDLGFAEDMFSRYKQLIRRPNGIILVTGPTGSGKTTTLYASLHMINSAEKNIITVEDPVEYRLPMIRQTQVNLKAGITFAAGLRSILRQDPDVIMVGAIRDLETSEIAIQAALTGHLVLSTLHTNDAPEAIIRLIDMGIEPFLVASSLTTVLAQRLVRMVCPHCKESYEPSDVERSYFLPPTHTSPLTGEGKGGGESLLLYRGKGCDKCKGRGYFGRTGIFELLVIDNEIRPMITDKIDSQSIKNHAVSRGMKTLRQDGIEKVVD